MRNPVWIMQVRNIAWDDTNVFLSPPASLDSAEYQLLLSSRTAQLGLSVAGCFHSTATH